MIYAIEVDGDFTFHEFLRSCLRRGIAVQPINLRAIILNGSWTIDVTKTDDCRLKVDDKVLVVNSDKGVFFRPFAPSMVDVEQHMSLRWENLIQGLSSWILFHQVNVINTPRSSDFNSIKSLHEHLLSHLGFCVPKSITTSDSALLVDFS